MNVTILDDYLDIVRTLPCFAGLAGHRVTVHTTPAAGIDELAERLRDTEALLLFRERTRIPGALVARLPRLRLISLVGPVPHVDLAACAEHGVTVCSRVVTERPSYATAELTWGLLLAAWRRIPQEMAYLRAGGWQSPHATGRQLHGRMLGILGFGRIGALVAGCGRAFGMQVRVWGRSGSLERAAAQGFEVAASESELFTGSDVVSVHLALTPQTQGAVRREHLALMRPEALFVNTSRAGLVAPGALLEALQAGRPGAAAVDVFDEEPVLGARDPLLALPNVVATPHLGYVTREGLDAMFATMIDQIGAFERGAPIHVVSA
ncbi:MAG: D-2-hydroxyacid dehydrogenase family protein [Rubrivivax sp.]|nr:D-2-hydroxyacid dehydrogenase family protein [Rubrivivax sp.]